MSTFMVRRRIQLEYKLRISLAITALLIGFSAAGHMQNAGAATSLLGRNLVVNGDAEAGAASPNGTVYVRVPGWSHVGILSPINVVTYGYDDFPGVNSPGPAVRGKRLFMGGVQANAAATQSIDLRPIAKTIAKGAITYKFSAYLGGWTNQGDSAMVLLRFLPGGAVRQLGPVTAAQRRGVTGLFFRSIHGAVPRGTRTAQVTLRMLRSEGTSNDGYVDNISLVLTP